MELIVLNGGEGEEPRRELAEDLMALVTSFAARISGKRGGKKK